MMMMHPDASFVGDYVERNREEIRMSNLGNSVRDGDRSSMVREETHSEATASKLLDRDRAELKRLFWKYHLQTILAMIDDIAVDEGVSIRRLGIAHENIARAHRRQLGETQ